MGYLTSRSQQSQYGAGHVIVLVACLLIVAAFAATWTGFKVSQQRRESASIGSANTTMTSSPGQSATSPGSAKSADDVTWQYEGADRGWLASATPPKCPSPLLKVSPIDTTSATAVLLPGQYRGEHYETSGGFRYDTNSDGQVQVRLPFDGRLVGFSHSMAADQYTLSFEQPCGLQFRLQHVAALSADIAKAASAFDGSGDMTTVKLPLLKAGTVVATAVGDPAAGTAVGIGMYDLRKPNQISQNKTWAALHANDRSQSYYGACWLSWLPKSDASRAQELMRMLPKTDQGASDYCLDATGGSTLQYNAGQPVVR